LQALTLQSRLQQGHHRAITYAPLGCAGPAHCVRSSSPGRPVTKTPVITPKSTMATPRFSSPAHSQLRLSRMRFHAAWMKIASKKHPCRLRYELRHRTSSNFFQVASHILELLRPAASRDVLQPDDRPGSHLMALELPFHRATSSRCALQASGRKSYAFLWSINA